LEVIMVQLSNVGERELYAALAMQALIAHHGWSADQTAKHALAYADALVEELKTNPPKGMAPTF
jgi:hypothetical protein